METLKEWINNGIAGAQKYALEIKTAMPDTYNHGFEDGYVAAMQDIKEIFDADRNKD